MRGKSIKQTPIPPAFERAFLVDSLSVSFAGPDERVDTKSETLLQAGAEYAGHIGDKWFNKPVEGANLPFGTQVAADGDMVDIHVYGHNDTASAKRLGMRIVVTRPDGTTKDSGIDWEWWPYTGAYGSHHFSWDDFIAIDQEGTWSIYIELWMS